MKRYSIVLLALITALLMAGVGYSKTATGGENEGGDHAVQKMLDAARERFNGGDYAGARTDAAKLIEAHPGSPLCADAQYLIALSHLQEGSESLARQELERFLKNYPNNSNTADAAATLRTLEARRFQTMYDTERQRQALIEEQNKKLEAAVEAMRKTARTDKIYLVIDLKSDLVMVKLGNATLYAFPCATGKGFAYLVATGKTTQFATPRGKLVISKKEKDPVWIRPDWYWLERGEEVPEGITREERAVYGHLGKYKLDLGDSFYIHGYTGTVKPGKITHGCIRVNDDDLELLWNITEVGTEVYIF